jgi:hypothetical protein
MTGQKAKCLPRKKITEQKALAVSIGLGFTPRKTFSPKGSYEK